MQDSNPLVAYLRGDATKSQTKVVLTWAQADPQNQELLKTLQETWQDQAPDLFQLPDVDHLLEQIALEEED